MNFQYTVNVESDEPIMLINRHIGFDEEDGMGIMGDLFQQELLALDEMGKKRIQVWINSIGGIVMDGYNIYNAILKSKTKVDTYCVGIAASISGVIFQAGRNRIMADYGKLMYHNPFGGDDNKSLDAMKASLVTMVASRSGRSEEEVSKMMSKTSWIGASEAFSLGLCDEIEVSSSQNKKRMASNDAKALWKNANQIVNKLFETKTISMKKVANRLKLNEEANEDSILAAIDSIENKATDAEKRAQAAETKLKEVEDKAKNDDEEMKNKMKDLEDEAAKHKAAFEKCQKELDEMKKKADDAEEEAKAEKAKNMVTEFAKLGKIKNEASVIETWTKDATVDFEATKKKLEDLPVNKVANKIELNKIEDKDNERKGYSAAGVMATIQAKMNNKK